MKNSTLDKNQPTDCLHIVKYFHTRHLGALGFGRLIWDPFHAALYTIQTTD